MKLSVALPAYLEEENLRLLLPRLIQTLESYSQGKTGFDFEILVLDTETPLDKTEEVCKPLKSVRYIRRRGGNTFGDAVRTGISESKGDSVIFMDADGSHTPEFIPELLNQAGTADVVIASRYIDGGYTENSASLVWMSRILNVTYSLVLGLKCKDVSNSFKLYSGQALRKLKLKCNNFDIVEEILYKLKRKNQALKITEIPFTFKKRMFGETKRNLVLFILTYVATIIKLRLDTDDT